MGVFSFSLEKLYQNNCSLFSDKYINFHIRSNPNETLDSILVKFKEDRSSEHFLVISSSKDAESNESLKKYLYHYKKNKVFVLDHLKYFLTQAFLMLLILAVVGTILSACVALGIISSKCTAYCNFFLSLIIIAFMIWFWVYKPVEKIYNSLVWNDEDSSLEGPNLFIYFKNTEVSDFKLIAISENELKSIDFDIESNFSILQGIFVIYMTQLAFYISSLISR